MSLSLLTIFLSADLYASPRCFDAIKKFFKFGNSEISEEKLADTILSEKAVITNKNNWETSLDILNTMGKEDPQWIEGTLNILAKITNPNGLSSFLESSLSTLKPYEDSKEYLFNINNRRGGDIPNYRPHLITDLALKMIKQGKTITGYTFLFTAAMDDMAVDEAIYTLVNSTDLKDINAMLRDFKKAIDVLTSIEVDFLKLRNDRLSDVLRKNFIALQNKISRFDTDLAFDNGEDINFMLAAERVAQNLAGGKLDMPNEAVDYGKLRSEADRAFDNGEDIRFMLEIEKIADEIVSKKVNSDSDSDSDSDSYGFNDGDFDEEDLTFVRNVEKKGPKKMRREDIPKLRGNNRRRNNN